jgi:hypothetical protein
MQSVDRLFSRPAQIVIGTFLLLFIATRAKHAYSGYALAVAKLPYQMKCKKDCEATHWRISDPVHCAEFDVVGEWTPWWAAVDTVASNTWGEFEYLAGSMFHSLAALSMYLVFGLVLGSVAVAFLYVIMTRVLAHSAQIESLRPANMIEQGNYGVARKTLQSRFPDPQRRVTWTDGDDD